MNISLVTAPDGCGGIDFPDAPVGWSTAEAERIAAGEGLQLDNEHWRLVRSLQTYFSRHEDANVSVRALKDALEEAFHQQGGIRYLHRLCPGGPVAQGCRLAGLEVPPGAVDPSFGSVQ